MSTFSRQNNVLYIEGTSLEQIATSYGTPCFVYSQAQIEQTYQAYAQALGSDGMVCYAVKANSNIGVLSLLARLGSGFDIVSLGELERVLKAGGDPSKIVFSGVGKTVPEIQRALEVGVHCFNVESEAELETLSATAQAQEKTAPISLRVNPDVDAKTHPYISTGLKENKFGIDIEQALTIYLKAASLPNVDIIGVDCHIGSQLTEIEPFLDALDRVNTLIDSLAKHQITIQHLDIGGGLGVQYKDERVPDIQHYIEAVRKKMNNQVSLIVEPGRSIVANAGALLTRVEYLKTNSEKNFAIIDAAMNDHIRPSLYQAWHAIEPVSLQDGQETLWDIVGPICETADFIGKDRSLALKTGDLLAVMSCGAYGFTMSSNYNSRPRAPEIIVSGKETHLVRRRETLEDLIGPESCLPN